MGIVICDKHGQASLVETCPHVAEEIDNKRYAQWYYAGPLLVCEDCLHRYRLEPFEDGSVTLDDALENEEIFEAFHKAYKQLQGRTIRCSECIAVAKVEQARRNGEPDPFPIYERTLNSNAQGEIDSLKQHLVTNFRFAQSAQPFSRGNVRALFINPGAYTCPLMITIYYVTSEPEQAYLIQLISDYFRHKALNQVKVEFYEAEVWELHPNPETGISSATKGSEKKLKEVLLNC